MLVHVAIPFRMQPFHAGEEMPTLPYGDRHDCDPPFEK